MAIITFWNKNNEQTGQTLSAVAIASIMAIEHNLKILLISTQYDDPTLELAFGGFVKPVLKSIIKTPTVNVDNGIEGLVKNAYSSRLTPEIIPNYTQIIYKNRLEILQGVKKTEDSKTDEQYVRTRAKYKDVIQNAARYYDMVIIDLERQINDEVTKEILGISNLIVYNIEQKIDMINDFLEQKEKDSLLAGEKVMLNVGNFDTRSKYTEKNIMRYAGIKKDLLIVPYNTLYFEAAREQKVADLFLKIRNIDDGSNNTFFIESLKKNVDKILYKLEELQMKM